MPFPVYYDDKRHRITTLPKRYQRYLVAGVAAIIVLWLYWRGTFLSDSQIPAAAAERAGRLPPLYGEFHRAELALPQHRQDLLPPDDKGRKYLFTANHGWGSGWGNILQEMFLSSYLAYSTQRSFVIANYTWNRDGSPYSDFNGRKIPSRIPVSALITGPMAGGHMPPGSTSPRFVKEEWFKEVCPDSERTIIRSETVSAVMSEASGQDIFETWVKYLKSRPERCIEVERDSAQVFSPWLLGHHRVVDIFPGLFKSPVMADFGWSSLVTGMYAKNQHLFLPSGFASDSGSWFGSAPAPVDQRSQIPGLLVLHVRRGDFVDHCNDIATWSSEFQGFNNSPEMLDTFKPPPAPSWGETTPENVAIYMQRCFPDIKRIVQKVQQVRKTTVAKGLRDVFIMTNAKQDWLTELKDALRAAAPWDKVSSSRDMQMTWEEKFIAQATDMLIGQKAQVFIGNGFSTLTSNIAMLRLAHALTPRARECGKQVMLIPVL